MKVRKAVVTAVVVAVAGAVHGEAHTIAGVLGVSRASHPVSHTSGDSPIPHLRNGI